VDFSDEDDFPFSKKPVNRGSKATQPGLHVHMPQPGRAEEPNMYGHVAQANPNYKAHNPVIVDKKDPSDWLMDPTNLYMRGMAQRKEQMKSLQTKLAKDQKKEINRRMEQMNQY